VLQAGVTRRALLWAAGLGGLWGLACYVVLWGYTPVVIHRSFVVGIVGTVLLLPVRLVLWGIRFVEERVAGHTFDFSANHGWIGVASAAVGAAIVLAAIWIGRSLVRRAARRTA
jgi:hypothetical protein